MSKKLPSFFCEFCGAEVDKWAIQCDKCGRIFDSIKCPKCSYVGKAESFPNGCPSCGFQSSSLDQLRDSIMNAQGKDEGELKDIDSPHLDHVSRKMSSRGGKMGGNELPSWVYLLMIALLLGGIGLMAIILLNIVQAE